MIEKESSWFYNEFVNGKQEVGKSKIIACVFRTYYWCKKEHRRKNNFREEDFGWK